MNIQEILKKAKEHGAEAVRSALEELRQETRQSRLKHELRMMRILPMSGSGRPKSGRRSRHWARSGTPSLRRSSPCVLLLLQRPSRGIRTW